MSHSFVSRIAGAALIALVAGSGAQAAGGYGYTWGVYSHDATLGVDHIGNNGTGNPTSGDTKCKIRLPILCVNVDNSPRPNYYVDVANGQEFYQGWAGGHYATTLPVKGNTITSAANGDSRCATSFGAGWRMAEFHDGAYVTGMDDHNFGNTIGSNSAWPAGPYAHGGWTAWGFGHVRSDMRSWVYINDQQGNCWNP
jgi:hypothetical protein